MGVLGFFYGVVSFSTNIPNVRLDLSSFEDEGDENRGDGGEHDNFIHDGSLSYIQIPSK